ncbi:MAG: Gfo/Idh/MocA family oxidoreductase, partial [Planctomycetales bacterium]
MGDTNLSRRDFMRNSARAASAATVLGTAAARGDSPNQRPRIGFIGLGARGKALLRATANLQAEGANIEPAAVCDVFRRYRDQAAATILRDFHSAPKQYEDYRDLLADDGIDAVCVAAPDHWHARMAIDAMRAGKHVYCETPVAHRMDETAEILRVWKETGRVMQVGVQRTSDERWRAAREWITEGKIGKVLHAQTHYFRNSSMGQWRSAGLSRDMTPRNINWRMFLGCDFGLAPEVPFDRALFAQWRCYWAFSHGIFSDLYSQVLTRLMLASGLGFPSRVTSGGGVFLEYDGRETPDVASLIADFDSGVQITATAAMGNDHRTEECIRGHHGTILFDLSQDGFKFLPQRPQVTRRRDQKIEHVPARKPADETVAHWENVLDAMGREDPTR